MEKHDVEKTIRERLRTIEKMLVALDKALLRMPRESLLIRSVHGNIRYYARLPEDTNGHYLGPGEADTVKKLEQKDYYLKLKKALTEEKKTLAKSTRTLGKCIDASGVYMEIPQERRHLIGPFMVIDDEALAGMRLNHIRRGHPRNTEFVTLNGEHVLSKSEVIIADRLKAAGVPYVYEPEVLMGLANDIIVHPDFVMWNRRTGQQWFWEHFGMIGDEEYTVNAITKLDDFYRRGILPGQGLVVTMETKKKPLSTTSVDAAIKGYLL